MSNKNSISYRQVGDYLIPNLIIPPEEVNVTLGKWGMMHKDYLEKHKKVVFTTLLAEGKLYQHCAEVEAQARDMFDVLVEQMKEAEGVTEQLKEENQLEWVQRMGNIQQQAREIVCKELIHAYHDLSQRLEIRFVSADDWNIPLAFDGVHFTQEGHRAFAEGIANYLNKGE